MFLKRFCLLMQWSMSVETAILVCACDNLVLPNARHLPGVPLICGWCELRRADHSSQSTAGSY
jgi:hypothetical protein